MMKIFGTVMLVLIFMMFLAYLDLDPGIGREANYLLAFLIASLALLGGWAFAVVMRQQRQIEDKLEMIQRQQWEIAANLPEEVSKPIRHAILSAFLHGIDPRPKGGQEGGK